MNARTHPVFSKRFIQNKNWRQKQSCPGCDFALPSGDKCLCDPVDLSLTRPLSPDLGQENQERWPSSCWWWSLCSSLRKQWCFLPSRRCVFQSGLCPNPCSSLIPFLKGKVENISYPIWEKGEGVMGERIVEGVTGSGQWFGCKVDEVEGVKGRRKRWGLPASTDFPPYFGHCTNSNLDNILGGKHSEENICV